LIDVGGGSRSDSRSSGKDGSMAAKSCAEAPKPGMYKFKINEKKKLVAQCA